MTKSICTRVAHTAAHRRREWYAIQRFFGALCFDTRFCILSGALVIPPAARSKLAIFTAFTFKAI